MKMCNDHWSTIRKAVDDRGLSHLVAVSGADAADRATRELNGQNTEADWDPLMSINWNLCGRVLETVGLMVMDTRADEATDGMPANDGHFCPMCVVRRDFNAHNTKGGMCGNAECTLVVKPGDKPWDQNLIDSCEDAMLEYAKERGLAVRH